MATERIAQHPARRGARRPAPAHGPVQAGKLLAVLAAAGMAYAWALGFVLSSLAPAAAQAARTASLQSQIGRLSTRNLALARQLKAAQRALRFDSTQANLLRQLLAAIQNAPAPRAAAQPSVSVSVPTVQATTGASGRP
jgi:hypothetical protein